MGMSAAVSIMFGRRGFQVRTCDSSHSTKDDRTGILQCFFPSLVPGIREQRNVISGIRASAPGPADEAEQAW